MKRIFSLFLCLILLTGCSVSKVTVTTSPNPSSQKVTLSWALLDEVPSALEQAADAYHLLHPEVTFQFTRYQSDGDYRTKILEQLHSDPPTVFSIHGESDFNYFQKNSKEIPLPVNSFNRSFSVDGVLYAFPITLYGYGIIYNARLLSVMGIDPSEFSTLEGLQQALHNINQAVDSLGIEKAVCTQTDLEELAVTDGLGDDPEAVPTFSPNLQTILSLVGTGPADDPAQMLANREAVLCFGSTRLLSSIREIQPELLNDLAIAPLPIQDDPSLVLDADWVIVNKDATDTQTVALKQFFSWLYSEYEAFPLSPYTTVTNSDLEAKILKQYQTGNYLRGKRTYAPITFSDDFSVKSEELRTHQINWGNFLNELNNSWEIGKRLE